MSKLRVHQLAKQLEMEPKDLIALLEKIRVRGKKSQSSLDDSEIEAVKAAIAATEKPKVTVGEERVVVDRTITAEDQDMGEVQAHEKVVERRVRANVIRRRRSTVELVTRKPIHPVAPPPEEEETVADAEVTPVPVVPTPVPRPVVPAARPPETPFQPAAPQEAAIGETQEVAAREAEPVEAAEQTVAAEAAPAEGDVVETPAAEAPAAQAVPPADAEAAEAEVTPPGAAREPDRPETPAAGSEVA
ncbi:MAG: translation initiation factor IF-2 N-terminal domain-containing protein, partial [Deltaproteobacteria bacterium]|nr:translation initiation factor IF-2 N-terminal domain-containing protein [Deltaproteobacteria bacterium]